MKRVGFFLVIIAMIGSSSCTSLSRKTELKTDIDTLSYFYGMSRADGAMNYLSMQAGIDTSYMDAFYKGFREGMKKYGPADIAFHEGMRIAQLINNQWVTVLKDEISVDGSIQLVNRNAMLAGFYYGLKNADYDMITNAYAYTQTKIGSIQNENLKQQYIEHIATNEKFLVDNKNKQGVQTTSSGLQYKIITEGTGIIPDEKARVSVNYRGTLVDGTEFDSSFNKDEPSILFLTQVVRGWKEALAMMPVGSKWELYLPQELAYGSTGQQPSIPPFSTLIFEVELLGIVDSQ